VLLVLLLALVPARGAVCGIHCSGGMRAVPVAAAAISHADCAEASTCCYAGHLMRGVARLQAAGGCGAGICRADVWGYGVRTAELRLVSAPSRLAGSPDGAGVTFALVLPLRVAPEGTTGSAAAAGLAGLVPAQSVTPLRV
jgi:hypothetical protein